MFAKFLRLISKPKINQWNTLLQQASKLDFDQISISAPQVYLGPSIENRRIILKDNTLDLWGIALGRDLAWLRLSKNEKVILDGSYSNFEFTHTFNELINSLIEKINSEVSVTISNQIPQKIEKKSLETLKFLFERLSASLTQTRESKERLIVTGLIEWKKNSDCLFRLSLYNIEILIIKDSENTYVLEAWDSKAIGKEDPLLVQEISKNSENISMLNEFLNNHISYFQIS